VAWVQGQWRTTGRGNGVAIKESKPGREACDAHISLRGRESSHGAGRTLTRHERKTWWSSANPRPDADCDQDSELSEASTRLREAQKSNRRRERTEKTARPRLATASSTARRNRRLHCVPVDNGRKSESRIHAKPDEDGAETDRDHVELTKIRSRGERHQTREQERKSPCQQRQQR